MQKGRKNTYLVKEKFTFSKRWCLTLVIGCFYSHLDVVLYLVNSLIYSEIEFLGFNFT